MPKGEEVGCPPYPVRLGLSLALPGGSHEAHDGGQALGTLHHMIVSGIEKRKRAIC
jgi:hypothetical protein